MTRAHTTVDQDLATDRPPGAGPLLRARGLNKTFKNGVRATVDVDLEVARAETLGIVGESGSGKSTTGKILLHLLTPDSGTVEFDGERLDGLSRRGLRELRRRLQLVPQNPRLSLNPRLTIGQSIQFNLRAHGMPRLERAKRVLEVLDMVNIPSAYAERRPFEMSGGQLQRVAIARALATGPELILCDEPVSSLDQSVQAHILNLLSHLQAELSVGFVIISHDMGVVEHIADRVAVMYLGRVVEVGPAATLWREPHHPYTQALLSAVPGRERIVLHGDRPDPARPPSGCVFRTLCPHAMDICAAEAPLLLERDPRHAAACHLQDGDRMQTSTDSLTGRKK